VTPSVAAPGNTNLGDATVFLFPAPETETATPYRTMHIYMK